MKESPLFAAIVVLMTSSGWPNVETSNIFSPAPSRRLLNLIGFFSSLGRLATVTDILLICYFFETLTKGYRVLRREEDWKWVES
jgi:hypothetical protein